MDKLLKLYIFCFLCLLFYVSKKLVCNFDSDSGQLCAIKEVRVVCDDQTSKECLKQLNQVIIFLRFMHDALNILYCCIVFCFDMPDLHLIAGDQFAQSAFTFKHCSILWE